MEYTTVLLPVVITDDDNSCLVVKMLSRRLKNCRHPYITTIGYDQHLHHVHLSQWTISCPVHYTQTLASIDVNWCPVKKGPGTQRDLIMGTASFNHLLKWRGKKVMQTSAQMMRSIKNRNLSITPGANGEPEISKINTLMFARSLREIWEDKFIT